MKRGDARGRIVTAAWRLFYEQGYENTTVEEIIAASGSSKGSFYHHFEGKDALLRTLSLLFDRKYEELAPQLGEDMHSFDKLMFLNAELFGMIENSVSLDLLARLYSSQLITRGDKHLMDHNRTYYRLLRRIASEGLARGHFDSRFSSDEIVKTYALCERALLYDWCLCEGSYSLRRYACEMLPRFMAAYRAKAD